MIRCFGYDTGWTGLRTCHCAAGGCHRTFTGIGAFDKHRQDGRCLDLTSVGLVPVTDALDRLRSAR